MRETQIHVVFKMPAEEEKEEGGRLHFLEWLDANIPYGTYEVQSLGIVAEPSPQVRYKSVKELNKGLRQLALRTLNTLDGLGLGRKGTLWTAWQALAQQDPLDDQIDEELRRKLERLQTLSEVIGKALGAIDSFDGAKRELDRVWEGVDRELDIDRAR